MNFASPKFWSAIFSLTVIYLNVESFVIWVSAFNAKMLINSLNGEIRYLYKGLHLKLPWEKEQRDIDLHAEVHEVCRETYPTRDVELIVKYVLGIRPNQLALTTYASFETGAITTNVRGKVSSLLSSYFKSKESKNLLSAEEVASNVFSTEVLRKIGTEYGVNIHVTIEDIDFTAKTQKFREARSQAATLKEVQNELVGKGYGKEEARELAELLLFGDSVTKNTTTHNIRFTGLPPTLQNVTGIPMPIESPKKGGDKK